jgi:hypothetical protein
MATGSTARTLKVCLAPDTGNGGFASKSVRAKRFVDAVVSTGAIGAALKASGEMFGESLSLFEGMPRFSLAAPMFAELAYFSGERPA